MSIFSKLETAKEEYDKIELSIKSKRDTLKESRKTVWEAIGEPPMPKYFGLSYPNFMLLLAVIAGIGMFILTQIVLNMFALIAICVLAIVIILIARNSIDYEIAVRRKNTRRR